MQKGITVFLFRLQNHIPALDIGLHNVESVVLQAIFQVGHFDDIIAAYINSPKKSDAR